MIIDPGFPDHWKVRELNRLSGTREAVSWMLRLWGECQRRRSQRFPSELQVARVCGFEGEPQQFVEWLIQLNWLEKNCQGYIALKWEEHNGSLIANWENGRKGGRPAKPKETHGLPMDNPTLTHQEPIRLDRSREEINPSTKDSPKASPKHRRKRLATDDFWKSLEQDPDLKGIDFEEEKRKMRLWHKIPKNQKRQITEEFVLNWLARSDRQLSLSEHSNGSCL